MLALVVYTETYNTLEIGIVVLDCCIGMTHKHLTKEVYTVPRVPWC